MTQKEIRALKIKLELYYDYLEKKYPITNMVIGAIDSLLEMDASDELIRPWYNSLRHYIEDIEEEVKNLETN